MAHTTPTDGDHQRLFRDGYLDAVAKLRVCDGALPCPDEDECDHDTEFECAADYLENQPDSFYRGAFRGGYLAAVEKLLACGDAMPCPAEDNCDHVSEFECAADYLETQLTDPPPPAG